MQILYFENSDSRPEQTPQQEIIVPTESTSRSTTRNGHVSVPPNWLIADPIGTPKTLKTADVVGCTHVCTYHICRKM